MEFLVAFEINLPEGTPESEVVDREEAEAAAAGVLVEEGHLLRVWRLTAPDGESRVLGLYRADDGAQLDRLLEALPLYDWMHVTVMPLEPHPNDPGARRRPRWAIGFSHERSASRSSPHPHLSSGGHPWPTARSRRHRPGPPADRAPDRRRRSPVRSSTGSCSRAPAPTGRSSCRTAPRSATSATRCRPTAAICSTSDHEASATAAPRSSHVSRAARTSTPANTRSAPRPRSRPPPASSTG